MINNIFENGKFGVGGYYNRIKKHVDNHLTVVDEATLRYVSLTLSPVCDEYYFEIVKEEKNE